MFCPAVVGGAWFVAFTVISIIFDTQTATTLTNPFGLALATTKTVAALVSTRKIIYDDLDANFDEPFALSDYYSEVSSQYPVPSSFLYPSDTFASDYLASLPSQTLGLGFFAAQTQSSIQDTLSHSFAMLAITIFATFLVSASWITVSLLWHARKSYLENPNRNVETKEYGTLPNLIVKLDSPPRLYYIDMVYNLGDAQAKADASVCLQIAIFNGIIAKKQQKVERLREQLETSNEDKQAMVQDRNGLKVELETSQQKITELLHQQVSSGKQVEKLQDKLISIQHYSDEVEKERTRLRLELPQLQNKLESCKKSDNAKFEEMESKIKDTQARWDEIQKQCQDLKMQLDKSHDGMVSSQTSVRDALAQRDLAYDRIQNLIGELGELTDDVMAIKLERNSMSATVEAHNTELSLKREEIDQLTIDRDNLYDSHEILSSEHQILIDAKMHLDVKFHALQKELGMTEADRDWYSYEAQGLGEKQIALHDYIKELENTLSKMLPLLNTDSHDDKNGECPICGTKGHSPSNCWCIKWCNDCQKYGHPLWWCRSEWR